MAQSDLAALVEMGFAEDRAKIAVKKTGGLQGALEWLEVNQDKSIEDITAAEEASKEDDETNPSIEPVPLKDGEVAKSLVCEECGKKLRSVAQAEAHGERTGHEHFAESTEEIAPLTEEEKKAKLAELRILSEARKAKKAVADAEERKKNEKIRMKSTREIQDIKEDLAKKEQIKAAADKRAEKLSDAAAKKRIQEKIAADREERRLKAEKLKAEREGRAPPAEQAPTPLTLAQSSSGPRPAATEARLRIQLGAGGTVMKTYPVETTLFEVAQAVQEEHGEVVERFTMTYPKKVFSGSVDFSKTLKEAGLVPSAVLLVNK